MVVGTRLERVRSLLSDPDELAGRSRGGVSEVIQHRSRRRALPLVSANAGLFALFGEKADEFLPGEGLSVSERTQAVLRRSLRGELPNIAQVARALATSGRSLQRALRGEGTSFQKLLDETRLDLARRHLKSPAVDAAEVSYLLGFTSPSSCYRAFKRWTGMTPEAYRLRA
jgi:AraC-like DNA-binding protein